MLGECEGDSMELPASAGIAAHVIIPDLISDPGDPRLPLHPRHVGRQSGGQVPGQRRPPTEPQSAQTEISFRQGRAHSDLIT